MKIKPIGKKLLIKSKTIEEKTSTGIFLVQNSDNIAYNYGTIIALSDDCNITSLFKIGQNIIFSKNSGIKIDVSGEELILIELENILGIIED